MHAELSGRKLVGPAFSRAWPGRLVPAGVGGLGWHLKSQPGQVCAVTSLRKHRGRTAIPKLALPPLRLFALKSLARM